MRLQYEPGTEKWIKWAKSKLEDLRALRARLGVPKLTRAYAPEAGTLVWISSAQHGDWIRITGATAGGRQYFSTLGDSATLRRFYRAAGSRLAAYSELTDGQTYFAMNYSFNGKTAVGLPGAGNSDTAHASISGTTPAAIVAEAGAISGEVLKFEAGSALYTASNGTVPVRSTNVSANGSTDMRLTEDGKLLAMSYARAGAAFQRSLAIYRLTSDGVATSAELLTRGLPQFVADFYAALPLPHTAGSLYTAGLSPDRRFVRVTGGFLGTYEVNVGNPRSGGGWLEVSTVGAPTEARVFYDPYGDQFGCVAIMPYMSRAQESVYSTVPLRYQLECTMALRVELRLYDPATGAWNLEYGETRDGLRTSLDGNLPAGSFDLTTVYPAGLTVADDVIKEPQAAVGFGLRPRLLGMYRMNAIDTLSEIRANGAVVSSTTSASSTLDTSGATGYTRAGVWWGPTWSDVNTAASRLWANFNGSALWTAHSGAAQYKYWESGALKATITKGAPAVANAANYPTYQALGVYGVVDTIAFDGFRGWRFDEQTKAKMDVYRRMTAPESITVQGGILDIPTAGSSFAIPADIPDSGFSLDGTLFWFSGVAYTEAEFGLLVGAPVDYLPNGVQYTIVAGSYGWETAVVDVEWDGAALTAPKVYSTAPILLPSRDGLTEYVPNATTASVSEASLVQDYLVMRRA